MSDRGRGESLLLPILIPVGALVVIVLVLFGFSRILLSLAPNAATATALVAALGIMGVAAFVASRRRVTSGALGAFVGATAGIAMLAGGIAIAVIGPPEPEIEPWPAAIAAPEGAIQEGFATPDGQPTGSFTFDVGRPIALTFTNEDPGVGHNIEIFDGPDDSAPVLFDGPAITGPDETVYDVPPMQEGEYFFICRLHPNTAMEGTITAEPGAGAIRVVAKDTAFDTDRIELPADQPAMLALDNEDPLEHNISIYEDESASGDPLFTFEPFTGPKTEVHQVDPLPEGEYYFRCDVHPVMEGTAVVRRERGGGGGEDGGGGDGGGDGGGAGEPSPSPEGGG
jgi:plastocyanin